MAGPDKGRLQDRGLCDCGSLVGSPEESSCDELRQVVAVHPTVLQEGHHEEDRAIAATGVPVLSSLLLVRKVKGKCYVEEVVKDIY